MTELKTGASTYQLYSDALHRTTYISNPTQEDLLAITPHLTESQRQSLFDVKDKIQKDFAVPALYVKDSFWVLSYYYYAAKDEIVLCQRYYQRNGKAIITEFANEAVAYAAKHWPDELIDDTWKSCGCVYLDDPTDLGELGYPRTKAVAYWLINRDWNELINDHSKPESELWNNALVHVTLDKLRYEEFRGGRGGFIDYNCANCASGLDLDKCIGCGHSFQDNKFRCGWSTPLADKIIAALKKGKHEFKVDPAIARQSEHEKWLAWQTRLRLAWL